MSFALSSQQASQLRINKEGPRRDPRFCVISLRFSPGASTNSTLEVSWHSLFYDGSDSRMSSEVESRGFCEGPTPGSRGDRP